MVLCVNFSKEKGIGYNKLVDGAEFLKSLTVFVHLANPMMSQTTRPIVPLVSDTRIKVSKKEKRFVLSHATSSIH